jgi:hypothetical protein
MLEEIQKYMTNHGMLDLLILRDFALQMESQNLLEAINTIGNQRYQEFWPQHNNLLVKDKFNASHSPSNCSLERTN